MSVRRYIRAEMAPDEIMGMLRVFVPWNVGDSIVQFVLEREGSHPRAEVHDRSIQNETKATLMTPTA